METPVGINGFGRIGRLALRAMWGRDDLVAVHVNEPHADAATCAHLLTFDSVHGRFDPEAHAGADGIRLGTSDITLTGHPDPKTIDWAGSQVDIVLECSGRFRTLEALDQHLEGDERRVIVAAPVDDERAVNVVMGVNEQAIDLEHHRVLTAASCTTNCLAPVAKVLHEGIGISHGAITTLHDLTNTQSLVDAPHKDLRRARAASLSLIPTTTGSASAIGMIIPQLRGRLDGIAVRVPLLNASLTDCVFEMERPTTVAEVNDLLRSAAEGPLRGILGFEQRPLVSVDYRGDARSSIVDALSTMVTGGTQVKVMAWYDNEWGYANRLVELAALVARSDR